MQIEYSISTIANMLGTKPANIHYYIDKGYLKATKKGLVYIVMYDDYVEFMDEYYNTSKRHSNRGAKKKLSNNDIATYSHILTDIHNNDFSYTDFILKYNNIPQIIELQSFIIFKRDKCIHYDVFVQKCKYKDLSEKYNLSIRSIEVIVNQNKGDFF